MTCGERGGDQPAVRDAADSGMTDTSRFEDVGDLLHVAPDTRGLIEACATRRLVGERERNHAAVLRERVHGRTHPFPSALNARNQHNGCAMSSIDDVHAAWGGSCSLD